MRNLLLLATAALLPAQIAPPPPPPAPPPPSWVATPSANSSKTFEVASVKLNTSGFGGGMNYGPGFLTLKNSTLEDLVTWAYGLKSFQIVAPQPWFRTEHYDVQAKATAAPDLPHLKLMLQALLTDRFRMTLHRETRALPIYTLAVESHGPKMKAFSGPIEPGTPDATGRGNATSQEITATHTTITALISRIADNVGRPVVDKTGLTGRWAFHLAWTQDDSDPNGMTIFTALKEQLGLRLDPGKGPVEVLVIDRAERIPTEN